MAQVWIIDNVQIHPDERRVSADGVPQTVGARAFDLLLVLLDARDRVIGKQELLDRVWPGVVVEENNLAVQIVALRKLLGRDAIATVPGRGYRLVKPVADGSNRADRDAMPAPAPQPVAQPVGATAVAASAPAAPGLVGRDAELKRLLQSLSSQPGVTLVGMAGVGKTSLARAASARWPQATAWVDLSALSHADELAGALARALGTTLTDGDAMAQLQAAAAGRALLLVLDNAEHLADACARWAAALTAALMAAPTAAPTAAPGLRLLITSQVALQWPGETVQRVDPLPVSGTGTGAGAGEDPPALALLLHRITQLDRRYDPPPPVRALLRQICEQLDGLPLALEMASARVMLMGAQAVHDALGQRFRLLSRGARGAPARHRTLHEALDWSHGLLDPGEQRLLRALGVFSGSFTLDSLLAVVSDTAADAEADDRRWACIDDLDTLVAHSLVTVQAQEPPRYRLLATVRAYAQGQLATAGEADTLRARHAAALLALFKHHATQMPAGVPVDLGLDMADARDALAWAADHDLPLAAQLSVAVVRSATFSPWRPEACAWQDALLPRMRVAAGNALPAALQAEWFFWLAFAHYVQRRDSAAEMTEEAVRRARAGPSHDHLLSALGLRVRAIAAPGAALDAAVAELEAAASGSTGSSRLRLDAIGALAFAARTRGDHAALLHAHEEEHRLALEVGTQRHAEAAETNILVALGRLGRLAEMAERGRSLVARLRQQPGFETNANLAFAYGAWMEALVSQQAMDEALPILAEAWPVVRRSGYRLLEAHAARLAAWLGRPADAARLCGYLHARLDADRMVLPRDEQESVDDIEAELLQTLGEHDLARWIDEGRRLDDDAVQALALALAEERRADGHRASAGLGALPRTP